MNSIIRLMTTIDNTISLSLLLLGGDSLITRARAMLVTKFMSNPEATHLMFIDSDISFDPEQFERLFRQDKDFVAAMYPVKEINWSKQSVRNQGGEPADTAGLDYVGVLCEGDTLKVENGFATATYVGAGFQLIKRNVFEKMAEAHPELAFSEVHDTNKSTSDNFKYALYDPLIEQETREYLSEDFAFCRRWRALGGDIWLDLKSQITHSGNTSFRGDTSLRFSSNQAGHVFNCATD